MPLYEFRCEKCQKTCELLMRADDPAVCPHCGATTLTRMLSRFSAGRSTGDADAACDSCDMSHTCAGPGCCGGGSFHE